MPKIISLSGDIGWEIQANDIRAALKAANGEDVIFEINSPGGFVFEGFEIYNIIKGYKGNTEARIIGLAASIASYIALAANKVTAFDNAGFFIHNAWNFAIGDHNDLRKTANTLESLSKIIALVYVSKTGTAIEDINALMDDETFFFGADMKSAGFVDEIIEAPEGSDNDTDKDSALITARASVELCTNKLRESDAANKDFQKAVAHLNVMSLLDSAVPKGSGETINPVDTGEIEQEDKHMTFKEYLAANPDMKAAHDAAISAARTEGSDAAQAEIKGIIAKVSPVLSSPKYPQAIKDVGIKAITGDEPVASFTACVTMHDATLESDAAAAAALETEKTPETQAAAAAGDDAEAQAQFDGRKKEVLAQGGF